MANKEISSGEGGVVAFFNSTAMPQEEGKYTFEPMIFWTQT
jgi:hypothetical protein